MLRNDRCAGHSAKRHRDPTTRTSLHTRTAFSSIEPSTGAGPAQTTELVAHGNGALLYPKLGTILPSARDDLTMRIPCNGESA